MSILPAYPISLWRHYLRSWSVRYMTPRGPWVDDFCPIRIHNYAEPYGFTVFHHTVPRMDTDKDTYAA